MGAVVEHVVALDQQTQLIARGPSGDTPRFAAGTSVALSWPQASETVFDADDQPIVAAPTGINQRIATNA